MKTLILVLAIAISCGAQFTSPFARVTGPVSSTPTYLTVCSGQNNPLGSAVSCSVTASSTNTIIAYAYNSLAATTTITTSSGTVGAVQCVATGGNSLCVGQITGATNPTVTATASSGYYLNIQTFVASGGTIDGGIGTCNNTTGCALNTSSTASIPSGNFVATANDLVLCRAVQNTGAALSGASTPVNLISIGTSTSGNWQANVAAGTYSAQINSTSTGDGVAGCVALHS